MHACTYILAVGIILRKWSMEWFNGKGQGGSERKFGEKEVKPGFMLLP
jgi:hypothetical protein